MDKKYTLSAVAHLFALACGLCTVYYIMTVTHTAPGPYYPQVLLVYAPALYGVDRLFLRSSRSLRSLIVLNGALFLALGASIILVEGVSDWVGTLFQMLFCLVVTVRCCQMAMTGPDLQTMILTVDLSFGGLLACVGMTALTGCSLIWCIPGTAGCAAAVLGLVVRRIDRRLGVREWSVIALAFGGLFLATWLLVTWGAAPVGQGLTALWQSAVSLAARVGRALMRFITWLISLLPDPSPGQMSITEAAPAMPAAEEPELEGDPWMLLLLMAAVAVGALVFLIAVLRRLGKIRIGGRDGGDNVAPRRRTGRISLWQALKRLWRSLTARWAMTAALWRDRNTAVGLFYLLIRRCRLSPWRKRPEETPREFLTRLQDTSSGDEQLAAAMDGLVPAVDAALYGPRPARQPYPGARLILRRFGAAARRQRRRRTAERIRSLLTAKGHAPRKASR